jgi:hypothetical protein
MGDDTSCWRVAAISLPRIHPPKSFAIGFSSARAAKQQQEGKEKGNWKGRWDEVHVHGEEWTTTAVVGKWTTVECE